MTDESRVAVVTGAGSGIGRAAATALLADGYRVVLAGRREELLRAVAAGSERALPVRTDVTDPDSVRALFQATTDTFGRVDLLVNNAGAGLAGTVGDLSVQDWNAIVAVNLTGSFLCAREAFRIMRDQDPAGRSDHQQRIHLGVCAAAGQRGVHGHQTRHLRADEVDLVGRPAVSDRLRADRHRQRGHRHGQQDGRWGAAGEWADRR